MKILTQNTMPRQPNQHELETKKGKILQADHCQICIFWVEDKGTLLHIIFFGFESLSSFYTTICECYETWLFFMWHSRVSVKLGHNWGGNPPLVDLLVYKDVSGQCFVSSCLVKIECKHFFMQVLVLYKLLVCVEVQAWSASSDLAGGQSSAVAAVMAYNL